MAIMKERTQNGVRLKKIVTEKFKTNIIGILIRTRLTRRDATKNALICRILGMGSKEYPAPAEIDRKLQEMYGAVFYSDILKKGGEQILMFYMEVIAKDRMKEGLLEEAMEFLSQIILNPLSDGRAFSEASFARGKNSLLDSIKSRKDDKRAYSENRLYEEMFGEEGYGIWAEGYEEDLQEISPETLFSHYKELIAEAPVEIIISGQVSEKNMDEYAEKYFPAERRPGKTPWKPKAHKREGKLREVFEQANVSQARLFMGFSTGFEPNGADLYPCLVLSEILGGAGSSRLYNSVREGAGLAYYVNSRFSSFTMCLFAEAGVEPTAYGETTEKIMKEIENIKNGDIGNEEVKQAAEGILRQYMLMEDSQQGMMDFYLVGLIFGDGKSIGEYRNGIAAVSREDIVRAARALSLDTVYFLSKEASA